MANWFPRALVGLLVTVVMLGSGRFAHAMGYYNLPGNAWHWWGHGVSGGYHAPLVLGPMTGGCVRGSNLHRQSYPPNPHACASCYTNGSYDSYGESVLEPTMLTPPASPQAQPAPRQPAPMPAEAPHSPPRSSLFNAPARM